MARRGNASGAGPRPWRRRVVLAAWLVAAIVISARAVQVQVIQSGTWKTMAEAQHRTDVLVDAPRGTILDRDGMPMAVSRETYRVGIAPHELSDIPAARELLASALGVSARRAAEFTDTRRKWVSVPGYFTPAVRERLAGVRGVYLERELQRSLLHGDLARGVVGTVRDGVARGGVEELFEDVLRGREGREVVARDNVGRPIPGETFVVTPPEVGGQVVLTLDMDLQEIARQALDEAMETTQARGGDVLVTDPRTGEILAFVSSRAGGAASLSAINTPYEPGSTLKPFTVAALLDRKLTTLRDTVDVGDGTWEVAGRTLHDVHSSGRMTVGQALRTSSNVGIAKAAQALTPGAQYETLRDFGFGVPTGLELPGEVGGTLRRPVDWSGQSPASLAIGYEVSVTSLQMAMAYGALANGGRLMLPRLVKEIRDSEGEVVRSFGPKVVRQVVSAETAESVGRALVDVVEDGTGTAARLGAFRVAGKSGTSRAYVDGKYVSGEYYSSFVGFFPAEDPQLVVFVKLERPEGTYYGGATAAPVTRATMEAALAARATTLDRTALLRTVRRSPGEVEAPRVHFASRAIDPPLPPTSERGTASDPSERDGGIARGGRMALPDVAGLPTRVAVRRLHHLGVRVVRIGSGEVVGTAPAPGSWVMAGDTVRLRLGRRGDE
ncbi:MAG: penicillin-binding transpeptidase domain-containing protein [Gemmatimonadota bacterium]|nr:penicillin-binding transpeptidase domain-containing protein [Gemmatimonadota bacterium]